MKTFLVLFAAAACLSISSVMFNKIEEDTLLKKLQTALPESWQMQLNGDTLKLEHPDPIWVLKSNYINAPIQAYEDSEENAKTILTSGIKTKAHVYFLVKSNILQRFVVSFSFILCSFKLISIFRYNTNISIDFHNC